MRHQPIEQILDTALPLHAAPVMSRRERLLRWADILKATDQQVLQPLKFVEFYAPSERRRLRADQSPLDLAFADPTLRAAGLHGDSLGEAQAFFGLSDEESHFLLCDCHWRGQMTGAAAAKRIRAVANPNPINRLWMSLQGE
jgi:hypothetical protein